MEKNDDEFPPSATMARGYWNNFLQNKDKKTARRTMNPAQLRKGFYQKGFDGRKSICATVIYVVSPVLKNRCCFSKNKIKHF